MPGFWRADGSYSDGSSDVQLTGSNVKKDTLFNALAITTITQLFSPDVDVSLCKGIVLLAINTLDQDVQINGYVRGAFPASSGLGVIGGATASGATIAKGGRPQLFTSDELRILKGIYSDKISFAVSTSIAPTSGSLTIFVYKVG